MKIISRFRGKYRFLSNFSESPFTFEGIRYPTVEHAYQERKTHDPKQREAIRSASTAGFAARIGRSKSTIVRDDWYEIKGKIMELLVYKKFRQNPELAKKLIETENAILIEGNYWHDNYFGICSCVECHEGEQPLNILGEILMDVRNRLREEFESILKSEPVHIVRRGTHTTLCSLDGSCGGLHFKWLHEIEAYRKKMVVGNELDMPTCPLCVSILKSQGIEIIKGYC